MDGVLDILSTAQALENPPPFIEVTPVICTRCGWQQGFEESADSKFLGRNYLRHKLENFAGLVCENKACPSHGVSMV